MSQTILVASRNPVKIAAARRGFQRMYPQSAFTVQGAEVPSGVPPQPLSEAETRRGARNRAERAAAMHPQAGYWVGIEGGLHPDGETFLALAWVCVLDAAGRRGEARTGAFHIPPAVAALIRQGLELGEANDRLFARHNSKQKEGAVGLLTGGLLDRAGFYEQAVILALIPLRNGHLWG